MTGRICPLLAACAALALANPVPEPKAVEPARPGNRGLPELRDPSGDAVNLSALLRSCARCHGERGPSAVLFEHGRLQAVSLARLRLGVRAVLNSRDGAPWYPTEAERAELRRAAQALRIP